ncbi:uncharacterized protein LOC135237057 isoform X2 [Anguilla rostrata]|uniref:uncharacterized protein LOC135237057 isoform X2 n=1 Tax=Anguilla rostrata TaxID=7938 RepID=UPI0030CC687A
MAKSPPRIWRKPGAGRPLYHLPWLDSCLEETLLPGKPWHKVYNRLAAALAHELETQLRDFPQSKCSWELLGGHFLQTFLPVLADQAWHSCPEGEGASVEGEIHKLVFLCKRAVESSRCQWSSDGSHVAACREMMDFVSDTYNLVAFEMEHMLAVEERKHQEQEELDVEEVDSAWALTARRRRQSVESRYLHLSMRRSSTCRSSNTEPGVQCASLTPPPLHCVTAEQRASPTPPPLHCVESEVLGGAISTVLTSDPGRMQEVCKRLGGRMLTVSLRRSVWLDKLLRLQPFSSDSTWSLERRERERFGRAVERRVATLKLRSATHSPVSGLIENAVVEAYEQTPCMQAFATSERMISESCKALNILYVHSGVYQPCLVHWLFPLQIAFQQTATKAEHCYELSMYLHLLTQRLFPSAEEVLAMGESVMRRLQEHDPNLHTHLQHCASTNTLLDPKDYAIECLAREREKVLEALDITGTSDGHLAATRKLLENPAVFLRKWIGEGLVGVLDLPAVLLVWDQLFMQDGSRRVMEDFCLTLLLLLRKDLLSACDYPGMREVLLVHASHLLTADIQRAWIHLQQGGVADDIPGFNRSDTRFLCGPFPQESALHGLLELGSEIQVAVFDPSKEAPSLEKTVGNLSSEESSFLYPPWIAHNPSLSVPHQSTVQQPFDLYIDSVHYIPDNATIIKVIGWFLRSAFEDLPDIVALPDLSSPARSPQFHFHLTVNPSSQMTFDPNMLLLLQVQTVCVDTGELRLIGWPKTSVQTIPVSAAKIYFLFPGSCIMRVFDDEGRLTAGGHQCPLRPGVPLKEEALLTESALQHQPAVPSTTVLFRLLPHTPEFVPAPDYRSGFYLTDRAKPNRSELEIISTFRKDRSFPETVQEMVKEQAEKEGADVSPEQAPAWLERRLGASEGMLSHPSPAHLPVLRMLRYRQQAGVRVRVTQAFGLPGGLYVNAFSKVLKGTLQVPECPQGWGGEESFLTRRHDFSSLQRAPRWTDQSSVLHPYLDPHTVLLVRLFALDAVYRPDPSGQGCGTVSAQTRGRLSQLAWTVIPLFEGPYASSGTHYAPLFQGSPGKGFLGSVSSCPVEEATAGHLKSRTLKLLKGAASVAVQVWDGHYLDDERPDLPVLDSLLPVDKKKKFLKTQSSRSGPEMSQLVLQSLSRKIRRKGRGGAEYQREESFYEEAMGSSFCSLMGTSLMDAGCGPL